MVIRTCMGKMGSRKVRIAHLGSIGWIIMEASEEQGNFVFYDILYYMCGAFILILRHLYRS